MACHIHDGKVAVCTQKKTPGPGAVDIDNPVDAGRLVNPQHERSHGGGNQAFAARTLFGVTHAAILAVDRKPKKTTASDGL
jgi:hypothetical protein